MSFLIVAAITVSTVYTASQQQKAAKAQAEEMLRVQQQEEMEAEAAELARLQELNATLAANQVAMAESGISGMTPESIALESARQVSSSESAIGLSQRLKSAQRARQASNIMEQGRGQAIGTLLSGAAQAGMYHSSLPKSTT